MGFLVTYPQEKVAPDLQAQLAAMGPTQYLPLRHLTSVTLTAPDEHLIATSDVLVLTSPFALTVYLGHLRNLAPQATVAVLSQKMATKLTNAGVQRLVVAPQENQASLQRVLQDYPGGTIMTWLRGNLTVAHAMDQLPKLQMVQVYQNTWSKAQTQLVADQLAAPITRILVTSPASFQRLQQVIQLVPAKFGQITYYVLGKSTLEIIRDTHQSVIGPTQMKAVLRQMLQKMCRDEAESR
ncbi:hypothetical protein GCM10022296_00590 [Secundilactobacillus similis DSM 23365 = JCM 2765]|uniref:Tetrapyrrole biosynthesis uroporphyrinogen III synthase domain-containing protein n=1 Tax=Secundilactobacillus similis DSM 23365 = JCM 2765 TaxID=1423804 RepID=A0A0R2ER19_9LACO|nr:hypothetical protein FD14_GL002903 [Secundilactobacillus similis DSM 23365 = JCM 2765]